MADTLTPHYHWTKVEPGTSPTTWGAKDNANLDAIDAQVFANASAAGTAQTAATTAQTAANAAQTTANAAVLAGVPIGGVLMWMTATAPANYFLCDGTVRSNTLAPALATLFGTTFGGAAGSTFGVPDMHLGVPLGFLAADPVAGILLSKQPAAAPAGDDISYFVLNYIVRYQ